MYNNSHNNFRSINSNLQHPIIVNSSNNMNASYMNDNIFTIPADHNSDLNLSSNNYNNMDVSCNGMRAIPGQQQLTSSNGSVAQPSLYTPRYIGHVNEQTLDQHTQYTSYPIESSSSVNALNITIHSPQTNLSEIFKFGFKIVILPISPPIMDNPNQHTCCLNSQLRQ